MKRLIIGAAFAALLASPASARPYNPGYGAGNVMNAKAAEHSDGALGYGAGMTAKKSLKKSHPAASFAYAPRGGLRDRRINRGEGNQS